MTDHEIASAMQTLGGSFARLLGAAFLAADSVNRERIRNAFPELIQEYSRLAQLRAEKVKAAL